MMNTIAGCCRGIARAAGSAAGRGSNRLPDDHRSADALAAGVSGSWRKPQDKPSSSRCENTEICGASSAVLPATGSAAIVR